MIATHTLYLELLALTLWAATHVIPEDEVVFEVKPETTITKTYDLRSSLTTDESVLTFGDNEMNALQGVTRKKSETCTVKDECGAVEDGRPLVLRRTYTTIERESSLEGDSAALMHVQGPEPEESRLTGHSVLFRWDAEAGDYSKTFDTKGSGTKGFDTKGSGTKNSVGEEAGSKAWLSGLEEDMDLRLLLPGGKVKPGERWTVGTEVLNAFFRPGGQVFVRQESNTDDREHGGMRIAMVDPSSVALWGALDGEVRVHYVGIREVGDRRLGVLEIVVEAEGALDAAQAFARQSRERGTETIYDFAELERTLQGKGKLEWDLERGCVHAFEFHGDLDLNCEAEWTADLGLGEMPISVFQVMSGTLDVELSTEIEE